MIPLSTYRHKRMGPLNTKVTNTSLKEFEAEECTNFYFEGLDIVKRPGIVLRTPTAIRSVDSKITGLFNYMNGAGANLTMCVADNGANVEIRDTFNNVLDNNGGPGFTTGRKFSFTQYLDLAIYCNNVEGIRKFDGTNSSALGGSPPSTAKVLSVHNNFVLAANAVVGGVRYRNKIFYSNLADPEAWDTSTKFLNVRLDDSDEIVGLLPFTEEITLIFKQRSIWALSGFSEAEFAIKLVWDGIGAANQWVLGNLPASAVGGRTAIFLSHTGRIYLLPLSAFTLSISEQAPIYASESIQNIISYLGTEEADAEKIVERSFAKAYFNNEQWYLFIPSKVSQGEADICIVYNYAKSNPQTGEFWFSRYESDTIALKPYSAATTQDISVPTPQAFNTGADDATHLASRIIGSISVPAGANTFSTFGPTENLSQTFTTSSGVSFVDSVTLRLRKPPDTPSDAWWNIVIGKFDDKFIVQPLSAPCFLYPTDLTGNFDDYTFPIRDKDDTTRPILLEPNTMYTVHISGFGPLDWRRHSSDELPGGHALSVNPDTVPTLGFASVTPLGGDFVFEVTGYRLNIPAQKFVANKTGTLISINLNLYKERGPDSDLTLFIYPNAASSSCSQGEPDSGEPLARALLSASTIHTGTTHTDGRWYTFNLAEHITVTNGTAYWIVPFYTPRYEKIPLGVVKEEHLPTLYRWVRKTSGGGLSSNKARWAGTIGDHPTAPSKWTCEFSGYSHYFQLNFAGDLAVESLITGTAQGQVWSHNIGTSDNGLDIRARYATAWLPLSEFDQFKSMRYFLPVIEGAGDSKLTIDMYEDFQTTPSDSLEIDLRDVALRSRIARFRVRPKGRFFQFLFHEKSTVRWKSGPFSVEYQIKKGRRTAGAGGSTVGVIPQPGGSGGSDPEIDPNSLSDILFRHEADTITGLSDGADVLTWTDLTGNGRHLTPLGVGLYSARYKLNIQNGLPMVEFWEPNYPTNTEYRGLHWSHGLPYNPVHGSSKFTFFFVIKPRGNLSNNSLGEMLRNNVGGPATNWRFEIYNPNPGSLEGWVQMNGYSTVFVGIPFVANQATIITLRANKIGSNPATLEVFKDGVLLTPIGTKETDVMEGSFLIWQSKGGGSEQKWNFSGYLGSSLGYGSPKSDEEIQGIVLYYKNKWGI